MMLVLDPNVNEIVNHFYNRLKNKIIGSEIQIERNSLLLTVIKLPVNQLSKLLTDSAINNLSFSHHDLEQLERDGLIRTLDELEKPNEYTITASGIWYIELNKREMDINRLLNYFQETKLSFKVTNKPLKNIEKTILFSMIAIRNFSSTVPMDINPPAIKDYWVEIFDLSTKFLYSIEAITKSEWGSIRQGNEHPISYVMRRANDLPQKTKHTYETMGKNKYFLDVDNEIVPPQDKLLFLYKIIFGKIETKELINDIYTYFCDLAYDKSKNVRESFEYINPEWDTILKEALEKLYYES